MLTNESLAYKEKESIQFIPSFFFFLQEKIKIEQKSNKFNSREVDGEQQNYGFF